MIYDSATLCFERPDFMVFLLIPHTFVPNHIFTLYAKTDYYAHGSAVAALCIRDRLCVS